MTAEPSANELGDLLETAEIMFKYALAVHQSPQYLASFSWGRHAAGASELSLTEQEEESAVAALEDAATYVLVLQVDTCLQTLLGGDRFTHPDSATQGAAWIARLIRNAFAHNPFQPRWLLYPECENRQFCVPDVIEVETTGLNGKALSRRDFGGPLAVLRLSQYVHGLCISR